jgi:hypothetical protein
VTIAYPIPTLAFSLIADVGVAMIRPTNAPDGAVPETHGPAKAAEERGAVILAEGSPVPAKTVPWPPYERALHALGLGDVDGTLHARVRLLGEIADLLTDTPAGPDGTPETVPSWIHDAAADLRAQLSIEAERLCQSAARLDAVRREIGHRAGRRARGGRRVRAARRRAGRGAPGRVPGGLGHQRPSAVRQPHRRPGRPGRLPRRWTRRHRRRRRRPPVSGVGASPAPPYQYRQSRGERHDSPDRDHPAGDRLTLTRSRPAGSPTACTTAEGRGCLARWYPRSRSKSAQRVARLGRYTRVGR